MASCPSLSSLCSVAGSSHYSRATTATLYQAALQLNLGGPLPSHPLGPHQAARLASRLAAVTGREGTAAAGVAAAATAGPSAIRDAPISPSSQPLAEPSRPCLRKRHRQSLALPERSLHSGSSHEARANASISSSTLIPQTLFRSSSSIPRLSSDRSAPWALDPVERGSKALRDATGDQSELSWPRGSAVPSDLTRSLLASASAAPTIPDDRLLELLRTRSPEEHKAVVGRLPTPVKRIDAYLTLRRRSPHLLREVSEWQLVSLFRNAASAGYSGIFRLLIEDLLGPYFLAGAARQSGLGFFGATAGTQRRATGLHALILSASRDSTLQLGEAVVEAFKLMLSDFQALRGDLEGQGVTSREDTEGGNDLVLPRAFPTGEARNLVRAIVKLGSPDLIPALQALQAHLAHNTPDFPNPREGSTLIALYLSDAIQDHRAALDVVKMMRETDAIGHDVLLQAQEDGQAWLVHARERLHNGHQSEEAPEPLRRKALEITLRIVGLKAAMAPSAEQGQLQMRRAFEALMATLRTAAGDEAGRSFGSPTAIASRHFRSAFILTLGRPGPEAVEQATSLLQRCDRNVLASIEAGDLQLFCEVAFAEQRGDLAAAGFLVVLKAKTSTAVLTTTTMTNRATPASLLSPEMLLRLLRDLSVNSRSGGRQPMVVQGLLPGLGLLPLTEQSLARWDQMFTETTRADAIRMLADADLQDLALALYQRWARFRFPEEGAELLSGRTKRYLGLHRRGLFRLSPREATLWAADANSVARSSRCMLGLVRMLTKGETHREASLAFSTDSAVKAKAVAALRRLELARTIVEMFKASKKASVNWTHFDLTSLAQAHFQLRDSVGAFDALQALVKQRWLPDEVDIAVLLSGLMTIDPDRAVTLLELHTGREDTTHDARSDRLGLLEEGAKRSTVPPATFRATANIVAQLLSSALTQRRYDLVRRLFELAAAQGLQRGVGMRSWRALLSQDVFQPLQLAHRLQSLVRAGFQPDGAFLDSIARQCLENRAIRFGQEADASSRPDQHSASTTREGRGPSGASEPPRVRQRTRTDRYDRRAALDAALMVTQLCYRELGLVNFGTVDMLLKRLRIEGRSIFPTSVDVVEARKAKVWTPEQRRKAAEGWTLKLDRLVEALRWAPLFDKGSDLRRGMPLWKSGLGRDGKLAMFDTGDVVDASKRLQDGHRKYSRRRAVEVKISPAEPPTSTAADKAPVTTSEAEGKALSSDEGDLSNSSAAHLARRPNVLPLGLFRDLMQTYLSLGDHEGAAEVAAWMRDEARADVAKTVEEQDEFVRHITELLQWSGRAIAAASVATAETANKDQSSGAGPGSGEQRVAVLEMLAGKREVSRKKRWWRLSLHNSSSVQG